MRKKKGIITTIILGICSLLLFSGCKHHHSKGAFILDYFTEALDLTQAQEEKLESIREELITAAEHMRKDREHFHDTLKQQITSETMDREVMRQLVADHHKAMEPLVELAIERLTDFHADLTAEQRDKLVAKIEKFEKYHHSMKK